MGDKSVDWIRRFLFNVPISDTNKCRSYLTFNGPKQMGVMCAGSVGSLKAKFKAQITINKCRGSPRGPQFSRALIWPLPEFLLFCVRQLWRTKEGTAANYNTSNLTTQLPSGRRKTMPNITLKKQLLQKRLLIFRHLLLFESQRFAEWQGQCQSANLYVWVSG